MIDYPRVEILLIRRGGLVVMDEIDAPVGAGGVNRPADVRIVQQLLNQHMLALGLPLLVVDSECGDNTIKALRQYQKDVVGLSNPDGRVDPGGQTWKALDAGTGVPIPAKPPGASAALSGKAWWRANQANYPNSAFLADLALPFRENVVRFTDALKAAGAKISVSATRRNENRAKLMNACWRIADGSLAACDVPAILGCDIRWDHGDDEASRRGAKEMVEMFQIAFQPSLTSLHILGRAVDMTISWEGTIQVKDAQGRLRAVSAPRSGENKVLQTIGASYGVVKLASDPPHWSDTGH
jgi:hypothetical protein